MAKIGRPPKRKIDHWIVDSGELSSRCFRRLAKQLRSDRIGFSDLAGAVGAYFLLCNASSLEDDVIIERPKYQADWEDLADMIGVDEDDIEAYLSLLIDVDLLEKMGDGFAPSITNRALERAFSAREYEREKKRNQRGDNSSVPGKKDLSPETTDLSQGKSELSPETTDLSRTKERKGKEIKLNEIGKAENSTPSTNGINSDSKEKEYTHDDVERFCEDNFNFTVDRITKETADEINKLDDSRLESFLMARKCDLSDSDALMVAQKVQPQTVSFYYAVAYDNPGQKAKVFMDKIKPYLNGGHNGTH